MKNLTLLPLWLMLLTIAGGCCELIGNCKEGCTDPKALNWDIDADEDCGGCCDYSNVVFYGSRLSPFPPVVVQVNGSSIGTIQAAYPSGPGNCIAPGVASFKFSNANKINWVATDAAGFIFSGTLSPSSGRDCVKVRVF